MTFSWKLFDLMLYKLPKAGWIREIKEPYPDWAREGACKVPGFAPDR